MYCASNRYASEPAKLRRGVRRTTKRALHGRCVLCTCTSGPLGYRINSGKASTRLETGTKLVVGRRGEANDFSIDDKAVSGRHLEMRVDVDANSDTYGMLLVTDLGSSNGTEIKRAGLFGGVQKLTPNIPYSLKKDDVVILATRVTLYVEPLDVRAQQVDGATNVAKKKEQESASTIIAGVGEAAKGASKLFKAIAQGANAAAGAAMEARAKGAELASKVNAVADEESSEEQRGSNDAAIVNTTASKTKTREDNGQLAIPGMTAMSREELPPNAVFIERVDQISPNDTAAQMEGDESAISSLPAVPVEVDEITPVLELDNGPRNAVAKALQSSTGIAESGSPFAGGIVNSQVQVNYKPTFIQGASADETKDAKTALLTAILGLDRGLAASDESRRRVQKLACALESSNPTNRPLRSPLMNGEWELQYTTCISAVGGGNMFGGKPVAGGVRQRVDMYSLKLINETEYSVFGNKFTNRAVADVEAVNDSRIRLNFTEFQIGPLKLGAPPKTPARLAIEWELAATGRGGSGAWLDTTYLDYDVRISRNDVGDLFILTKLQD